ncbi:MAG: hypothetical protein AAGA01_01855 [Cyanobacteria bacterium P01_E01_bin.43]
MRTGRGILDILYGCGILAIIDTLYGRECLARHFQLATMDNFENASPLPPD